MAKKKKKSDPKKRVRKKTLEELKKKGIELDENEDISGGFVEYCGGQSLIN